MLLFLYLLSLSFAAATCSINTPWSKDIYGYSFVSGYPNIYLKDCILISTASVQYVTVYTFGIQLSNGNLVFNYTYPVVEGGGLVSVDLQKSGDEKSLYTWFGTPFPACSRLLKIDTHNGSSTTLSELCIKVNGQIFNNGILLTFTNYSTNGDDLILFGDLTNGDRQFVVVTGSKGTVLWKGTLLKDLDIVKLVRLGDSGYFYFTMLDSDSNYYNLLYILYQNGTLEYLNINFTIPFRPPYALVENSTIPEVNNTIDLNIPSIFIDGDNQVGMYNIITGWDWIINAAIDPLLNYSLVPSNYRKEQDRYWINTGVGTIVCIVIGCDQFDPSDTVQSWVQAAIFNINTGKIIGYSKAMVVPGSLYQGSGGSYTIITPAVMIDGSIGVTLSRGYIAFDPKDGSIISSGAYATFRQGTSQAAYNLFTSSGNYLYGDDSQDSLIGSPK